MRLSIVTSLALTGLAAAAPNTPRYSVQSYNAHVCLYHPTSHTVATEKFSFTPVGLLSKMEKVAFYAGAWKAVDEVQFTQTTVLSSAIGVLYDNLQYTTVSN